MVVRAEGLWHGEQAVVAARALSEERARSLEFRLENEDLILTRALEKRWFGWGGWGRWRVRDDEGRDITISDGLWVIALGETGLVGLASLTAMILLPVVLLLRRVPAARWGHPAAAPAAALAVLLVLYMLDSLANAMPNPIYMLAAGGLGGLTLAAPRSRSVADPSPRARPVPARVTAEVVP